MYIVVLGVLTWVGLEQQHDTSTHLHSSIDGIGQLVSCVYLFVAP